MSQYLECSVHYSLCRCVQACLQHLDDDGGDDDDDGVGYLVSCHKEQYSSHIVSDIQFSLDDSLAVQFAEIQLKVNLVSCGWSPKLHLTDIDIFLLPFYFRS